MGFSSLIPKTVGRRSIDNIVVPRELLHIVREKEHRFPSFLALWSKKEGRDYSPKELPLCIHMARKCKNTKKNTKNNHLNLCLLDGVREDGVWENRRNKKIFRSPWKKSYSLGCFSKKKEKLGKLGEKKEKEKEKEKKGLPRERSRPTEREREPTGIALPCQLERTHVHVHELAFQWDCVLPCSESMGCISCAIGRSTRNRGFSLQSFEKPPKF